MYGPRNYIIILIHLLYFESPGWFHRRVLPRRAPVDPPMGHKPTGVGHRRQRKARPGNPVLYNQTQRSGGGGHRSVPGMQQRIRPHSTPARAPGHSSATSSLLAADPGPTCPGILVPPLEPLRRVCPLYNLVVVGPRNGD